MGHRGVRGEILLELKRTGRATAGDLAAGLGLSLNAVRHHLKELEHGGLAVYEREHKGVGAPSYAYRLTRAGESLFPQRYDALINDMLDGLVAAAGRPAAVAMLSHRFAGLRSRLEAGLQGAPASRRLEVAARLLSEEGFMAEAVVEADGGMLVQQNCPIRSVAERFPEVCAAEAECLAQALGAEVERRGYLLTGCGACAYRVRFSESSTSNHTLEHA